ncbi:MAG: PAS domain-containing protein [Gammaproteobacteria bacterium]|nr:PAS domain-containing protein [Gammaproteobacteria bacterium]
MLNGDLWISRKGGISHFNKQTGIFKNFDQDEDGVPFGPVASLLKDDEGYLWLGTVGGGLVRFDPTTGATKRFTADDGLQDNTFFLSSRLKAKSGEMWFGGSNGISSFHPLRIKENPRVPPIVLTAFTQGGQPVSTGTSPERLREVTLDWRSNYFEFQFSALNFTAPEKNRYAYMLEGWDEDWYYSGSNPFGRYSGLAGGRYKLRLRGSNNDGVWNDEGISITVIVKPPFWETGWFSTTIVAVGLTILVLVVFYMRRLRVEITDRKQAEKKFSNTNKLLKNVIDSSQDLIFVKDTQLRTILCNSVFAQAMGKRPEELYGRTDIENGWSPELVRGNAEKGIRGFEVDDREALGGGSVHNPSDPANIRGEIRYFDTLKMALRDGAGDVFGVLGVSRDITERKQTEQTLRRAQKMDAIGQLTGGIAHDFNNILGIILGNLDLLKGQVAVDDNAQKRLDNIRKSAQRAAALTKQLLGFSRHQATEVAVTDIRRVMRDMDSLIARSVTPQIEVTHQFAENLWLTEIDPGDFQDALFNLIINARDAMPEGGGLTLETANKTLDTDYCALNPGAIPGEYIQLAVSDSGTGIPHDQQEHIFEPFYTTKDQGKGTGLGLAMVYGFVKRSGGYIKLYSEQGIGTTFRLYLPRAKGEEQPLEATDELPETLPRGTESILVVDDEDGLLEVAQSSLQALDYRVLSATNGRQALAKLAEEPTIDLLFSDVVMPGGMNGYELAERATAKHPKLKVLLTSGYTEKTLANNGQARFTANLLIKPYNQAELALQVRALLDGLAPTHVDLDDSKETNTPSPNKEVQARPTVKQDQR